MYDNYFISLPRRDMRTLRQVRMSVALTKLMYKLSNYVSTIYTKEVLKSLNNPMSLNTTSSRYLLTTNKIQL